MSVHNGEGSIAFDTPRLWRNIVLKIRRSNFTDHSLALIGSYLLRSGPHTIDANVLEDSHCVKPHVFGGMLQHCSNVISRVTSDLLHVSSGRCYTAIMSSIIRRSVSVPSVTPLYSNGFTVHRRNVTPPVILVSSRDTQMIHHCSLYSNI